MLSGYKREVIYTVEDAKKDAEAMFAHRINDMTKIKLKCWIAYCEYARREENQKQAMQFDVYCNIVAPYTYMGHINSGEINCDDIGGKEAAILIVKTWFGIKEE
jgi:hypothetical protein